MLCTDIVGIYYDSDHLTINVRTWILIHLQLSDGLFWMNYEIVWTMHDGKGTITTTKEMLIKWIKIMLVDGC